MESALMFLAGKVEGLVDMEGVTPETAAERVSNDDYSADEIVDAYDELDAKTDYRKV
jgi:hypothetical protein